MSLSSKAFFIARNAVSFGLTLVLLSGKKAPEIIQTAPFKLFCRCQHVPESKIQQSGYGRLVETPARDAGKVCAI